jgi:hypothetical protein
MDLEAAGTRRKMQLSELDEWHEKANHNTKIYKREQRYSTIRGSRRSLP